MRVKDGKSRKNIAFLQNAFPFPLFIMLYLTSNIPNYQQIKNIIFDFGGVICDLDIQLSVDKFKEFGAAKAEFSVNPEVQDQRFEQLAAAYESGNITSQHFRNEIRNHYAVPPTDQMIDDAWNALLLGIPEERIHLLESIRNTYRIFLLSNSNEIHFLKYSEDFSKQFHYPDFDSLFESVYFSYLLHLKKPDPEIFKRVINDKNLDPGETLFIDDTLIHIESARTLGINGYHLKQGEQISSLFKKP